MSCPMQPRISSGNKFQIATIGRITRAKDPAFFLNVKKRFEGRDNIEWHWLGDGEPSLRQDLISAGVRVSGWLSKTDLSKRLENIQVIVITSLWDAGPITLYLAVGLGIPVVIRDFPAGKILGLNHGLTVEDFGISLKAFMDVQEHEKISTLQRSRVCEIMNENSPRNINDVYQMLERRYK